MFNSNDLSITLSDVASTYPLQICSVRCNNLDVCLYFREHELVSGSDLFVKTSLDKLKLITFDLSFLSTHFVVPSHAPAFV